MTNTIAEQLRILLNARQRRRMLFLLAGMLLAAVLEMMGIGLIPAFVGVLMEPGRVSALAPGLGLGGYLREMDVATITVTGAALLAAVFLIKNVYLFGLTFAEARVLRDVTTEASHRLFHAYLYSPYTFHLQRNPAQLIRNISIETIQAVTFLRNSMRIIREGLVLAVIFILLVIVDPVVSLAVFMLLGTAAAGFYVSVRRALGRRGTLAQEHRGRQVQTINQGLGAIKDAKVLGREPFLLGLFEVETQGKENHELYQKVITALPRLFLEVIAIGAVLLVSVVFVLLDRPPQDMLPVLALLAVAVVRLVPALNGITSALSSMRYYRAAFDLISDELRTLERMPQIGNENEPTSGAGSSRFRGALELRDLHYSYPGASEEALAGVSLRIEAGEAVAFTGTSGAGKSTLVDLILGLLTPSDGFIRVDGRDVQENIVAWQRQIGYVPQDIYLVDDSIRRNIAFGIADEEIDERAVMRALRAAQLDTFVQRLPDGLDTMVGNRGIRLSGGQRQRIGIARALYHDPAVLVLDEATSALDNETEREIIGAVVRLRGDRTLVIVAHRLTTIRGCDRIYLLEDGRVKDCGTYAELEQRHQRLWRTGVEAQSMV